MTSFVEVIEDLCSRKSSLRLDDSTGSAEEDAIDSGSNAINIRARFSSDEGGIGDTPPTLQRMDGVSKCMDCGSSFTFKRKHHCHACGIVS